MDVLDFNLAPLRDFLPKSALDAALAVARRISFSDGQALHVRGDDAHRLCIVARGAVKLGRFTPDGAFHLVSMVGQGGHFGEVSLQRTQFTHDGFAVGGCEIDVINAASLERLVEEQDGFAAGLWRASTSRMNALLELYDDARTLGIPARAGKVLYVHLGRGEQPDGVACRQRDLADLLGVTQVSICNALKELERAGLIEVGYGFVRVPDKARLKAWLQQSRAA